MDCMILNRFNDQNETIPVVINIKTISFFYPWDGRNKGTYIALGVGGGDAIVVKESFDEILDMLKGEFK